MLNERKTEAYCAILAEELRLATGCTEPIAVAYCAAKLREVLGGKPEKVLAEISGNILKNVKSVVVPNTGGRRGIEAAIAVGIVAGDPDAELQVLAKVTEEDTAHIQGYLDSTDITVTCPETPCLLDIRLTGWLGGHKAVTRVANNHTNLVYIEKDGQILLEKPESASAEANLQDKSVLNVKDILTFIETVPIERIRPPYQPTDPMQRGHRRRGTPGRLGRQHRLHPALHRQRHRDRGPGLGCRRVRRPDERVRDAGGHLLRQRQPGHHGLGACVAVRPVHGCG